jgi:hypothetical protein
MIMKKANAIALIFSLLVFLNSCYTGPKPTKRSDCDDYRDRCVERCQTGSRDASTTNFCIANCNHERSSCLKQIE